MNKAKLKSYAPAARRDFIQAVTDRAHYFGLSEKEIIPVEESGDVAIIGGRPFPRSVATQRRKLEARVKQEGFNQVMEAVAYTWFNRFLALRYMELHGYLEHGFRVLSNTGSSTVPEILDHATQLDLPGLNKQKAVELKLDGSKDAELYRLLLVAQCNELHAAMPFLFEKIEDETELLLPDNLLHSDSLIRKLVAEIEEEDWQEVEIIGWLYQFYISEKKDQVIGKVVKSEDIPAATQLFTPNWIVKYMVQNSLGRKWLATYPSSPLRFKMEYYIEPAEQSDEVKTQLTTITHESLDPEKLTLLDPASGSGHILVEAYDVFREIYTERGYTNRDYPRLILEKNLFGLDIDDRAAQMAGFALLMKARKDDRRILRSDNPVKLNVMSIHESGKIVIDNAHWGLQANAIRELIDIFSEGKAFGSLILLPESLTNNLAAIEETLKHAIEVGDLYVSPTARELMPLVAQAKILAKKYDSVVANPPYLGNKVQTNSLKELLKRNFEIGKTDLFSAFILRNRQFVHDTGYVGMMTPFTWLFITTYTNLRRNLLENNSFQSVIVPEYHSFFDSAFVPICAFVFTASSATSSQKASFIDLEAFTSSELQEPMALEAIRNINCPYRYNISQEHFLNIPDSPFAYKLGSGLLRLIEESPSIDNYADAKEGFNTGDNDRFLRFWFEPSMENICLPKDELFDYRAASNKYRWFPCNKGGPFRRWYGNNDYVVDWENDGDRIKNFKDSNGKLLSALRNLTYSFRKGATWSGVGLTGFSARYFPQGYTFNSAGRSVFTDEALLLPLMGALNSNITFQLLKVISPTLSFTVGNISNLPFKPITESDTSEAVSKCVTSAISIARNDWDSSELSWDFIRLPLLGTNLKAGTLPLSWGKWSESAQKAFDEMKQLETENNRLFIVAYGLQEELTPEVSEDQITLARADREGDIKRLISFAIASMMGRYSLDHPGLIYANSGNIGFDQSKYETFPADDDGIVPVMDMDWFPDDAASRFEEFLTVAWSPETLEENLKYVADSLAPKGGESSRETIRRYISTQFYKDHMQTYKKRPIYWLFSSGKQRAFECLVYLHRYNDATLSRMRNEYVTPLQGKFSAQAEYLDNEVKAAISTAESNRLQKQLDTLRKKQVELSAFDDLLRHYADQRISLDLDDGVKVNYGKFGGLLAEVKAVTGGSE